jgi:hypothetical protein
LNAKNGKLAEDLSAREVAVFDSVDKNVASTKKLNLSKDKRDNVLG